MCTEMACAPDMLLLMWIWTAGRPVKFGGPRTEEAQSHPTRHPLTAVCLAMSAIHSPAAPPARPPFRRSTTGVASPLREPSQPQPTPPAPPSLTSRRAGLVALLVAAAAPARPAAAAFSLGIRTTASSASPTSFLGSAVTGHLTCILPCYLFVLPRAAGPKELLREQKKKSASFLLAPIAASRDTLVKAHALLGNSMSSGALDLV
jgi:hypothetical protein